MTKLCSCCGYPNKIVLRDFGGNVCGKCLESPKFVSPAKYRPTYTQLLLTLSDLKSKEST